IIVAQAQEAPPPVESLRPDVPEPLAALVQRMLAKDPARRPQMPREVAEALVPFVKPARPRATVVPAVTTPNMAGTAVAHSRRWLIPAAVAAGLLLAVGGVVAAVVLWLKVPGGVVMVEVEPPDAKVEVVDGKITVSRPGDAEPWR